MNGPNQSISLIQEGIFLEQVNEILILKREGKVRKPLYIATTVIFLSILAFPQTAFADDNSDNDSGWEHVFDSGNDNSEDFVGSKPDKPVYDSTHKHKKLEDQYGDVNQVGVPQIVIRPGTVPDPGSYELPVVPQLISPTSGVSSLGEVEDNSSTTSTQEETQEFIATQLGINFVSPNEKQTLLPTKLNPAKSTPIQIRDLVLTKKTPADEFLDGAILFGVGLSVLALGLLAVTGFTAVRLRRESKGL